MRTQQASFEDRYVDFQRSHDWKLRVEAQTLAVRVLLETWTQTELCLPSDACQRMSETVSLPSAWLAFVHERRSFQARNFSSVTRYPQLTKGSSTSCTWKCVCEAWSIFNTMAFRTSRLSEKKRSHSCETNSQRQPHLHRWRTIRSACQHCTALVQRRQLAWPVIGLSSSKSDWLVGDRRAGRGPGSSTTFRISARALTDRQHDECYLNQIELGWVHVWWPFFFSISFLNVWLHVMFWIAAGYGCV